MLNLKGISGIDWFECTIFPHTYMDVVIGDLARCFGVPEVDVDVHPTRLWNYDGIACFHKMDVYLLFRSSHSWSPSVCADTFDFDGDLPLKKVELDHNGNDVSRNLSDVHLVVTGVGMRWLGEEHFRQLTTVIQTGYTDFVPTRIDVCCDFFEDCDLLHIFSDACMNELKLARGESVDRDSPRLCTYIKRNHIVCHQSLGGFDWYLGTRGKGCQWYFRSYNKAYEQESKHGDLAGLHEFWHRFEYETRGCAALNVWQNIVDQSVSAAFAYCVQSMFSIKLFRYMDTNTRNADCEEWTNWVYSLLHCEEVPDCAVSAPYSISLFILYSCKTMSAINVLRAFLSCPSLFEDSDVLLDQLYYLYCKKPKYASLISDVLNGRVSYSDQDIVNFATANLFTLSVDYDYSNIRDRFYDLFV